jgi:6-phosphogluconolactonase (cycloisomerase 2 family)
MSITASLAALAIGAGTLTGGPAAAGAVFVQTDAVGGNTVVAYDRTSDGQLHQAGTYATGGNGGILTGSVVDHQASQGSLALDRAHHLLYATNAGSDTVTVFGVRGDHLTRLQTISSGGRFPVSVTVHGDLVYVLNARDGGSIQGYRRIGAYLVRVPSWHRGLGLAADPAEFTHTPGQVAFTPDGSKLIVTTKAGANTIDVFGVSAHGGPAATPTVTSLPGAVPFAVAFDRAGRLVVAEAGPNAVATFTVQASGTLTAVGNVATGQAATCWIAGNGRVFWASNAGSGTVTAVTDTHGTLTAAGNTATGAGSIDATVSGDGRFLYVQSGAAGEVHGFRIGHDGALTPTGTVTVPDAAGGEGIAAS